jgi:hypothetical protein
MEGGGRTVYVVKKQQTEEEKKTNTSAVGAKSGPMRLLTVSSEGAVFYRL